MKRSTIVVLVALIALGMDMAFAESTPPRKHNKPGSCPKVNPGSPGICVEKCNGDQSCPQQMKCCSNGCGHVCMKPVFRHHGHGHGHGGHVNEGMDVYDEMDAYEQN